MCYLTFRFSTQKQNRKCFRDCDSFFCFWTGGAGRRDTHASRGLVSLFALPRIQATCGERAPAWTPVSTVLDSVVHKPPAQPNPTSRSAKSPAGPQREQGAASISSSPSTRARTHTTAQGSICGMAFAIHHPAVHRRTHSARLGPPRHHARALLSCAVPPALSLASRTCRLPP